MFAKRNNDFLVSKIILFIKSIKKCHAFFRIFIAVNNIDTTSSAWRSKVQTNKVIIFLFFVERAA